MKMKVNVLQIARILRERGLMPDRKVSLSYCDLLFCSKAKASANICYAIYQIARYCD